MFTYYGVECKNGEPSAATEHTAEPQLSGYQCTHNTSLNQGSASIVDEEIVATEHVRREELDILLTIADAAEIRSTFKEQPALLHTEAREHLNKITEIAGHDGAVDVYYIDDSIRWKEYIAMHAQCEAIIGAGIIAAHLERIHNTRDPNRQNNARVDYVFYRADNTFCRVHPGTRRQNDAKLNFAKTSTCYRAVQVHDVAPNPMTFTAAMQIPMKDKMGKAEAWRQLSQRDDALIDVTEHDNFKWWLFLSNLGPNTRKAFGSGIKSVQIHKREDMIGLRTEHTDLAVQWVILTPHKNWFKTRLATSFQ